MVTPPPKAKIRHDYTALHRSKASSLQDILHRLARHLREALGAFSSSYIQVARTRPALQGKFSVGLRV